MGFELVLGILATLAEEESRSISQSMNWSRIQHLKQGEPWEAASYGYKSVGERHKWEIVPREAEIIRKAFYMAGMCYKIPEILRELNRMEVKNSKNSNTDIGNNSTTESTAGGSDTGCGNESKTDSSNESNTSSGRTDSSNTGNRNWNRTMLRYALTNLVYKGDYLSNKEVCIVEKDGKAKRVKNKGHVGQILLEGHHEAIVSRELFDVVQKLIKAGLLSARKSIFSDEDVALMKEAMELAAAENNTTLQQSQQTQESEQTKQTEQTEQPELERPEQEQMTAEQMTAEQTVAGKLEASPWQM